MKSNTIEEHKWSQRTAAIILSLLIGISILSYLINFNPAILFTTLFAVVFYQYYKVKNKLAISERKFDLEKKARQQVEEQLLLTKTDLNSTEEKLIKLEDSFKEQVDEKTLLAVQASKLASLEEMAGAMAHEINNPLTIIHGSADLLQTLLNNNMLTAEKAQLAIQRINKTVNRISKIIECLRAYSTTADYTQEYIEVDDFVEDFVSLCGEHFYHAGITLTISDNNDSRVIYGNASELNQVMMNLLFNSYDALKNQDEKWVRVYLKETETSYTIEVLDSGPGIPLELHKKVLEPFFTTKSIGEGTGLGLSISRSLILKNNGNIAVNPDRPNTSFIITLPKPEEPPLEASL